MKRTYRINAQAFATLTTTGNIKGLQLLRRGRNNTAVCRISGTRTTVLIVKA